MNVNTKRVFGNSWRQSPGSGAPNTVREFPVILQTFSRHVKHPRLKYWIEQPNFIEGGIRVGVFLRIAGAQNVNG